jgi:hypothetical protein
VEPRGFEPPTSAAQSQDLITLTFAIVQNRVQNRVFNPRSIPGCSLMFKWIGVLLV